MSTIYGPVIESATKSALLWFVICMVEAQACRMLDLLERVRVGLVALCSVVAM